MRSVQTDADTTNMAAVVCSGISVQCPSGRLVSYKLPLLEEHSPAIHSKHVMLLLLIWCGLDEQCQRLRYGNTVCVSESKDCCAVVPEPGTQSVQAANRSCRLLEPHLAGMSAEDSTARRQQTYCLLSLRGRVCESWTCSSADAWVGGWGG